MTNLSEAYLNHLIRCTDIQCRKTKEYTDASRHYFSNNRNAAGLSESLKELIFTIGVKDADGAYFTSLDERNYLDITMGFGVHLFGHKVTFLETAMQQQLKKGLAIGPLYENAAEVAQLIHDMTGADRCAFFNSGTEAVMVAMRIARAATGKNKIVIFEGAYHGTHDSLLALKSDAQSRIALSTVPGITQHFTDHTILLEFGKQESTDFIREHAHDIAAVLTEPVQSRHIESSNPQFLIHLREITAAHNIVFILDEIITGFRIANTGAAGHFNIQPDLTTFGKVVGGGMPIGIVAGKRVLMDYIDGGSWKFGDASLPTSSTTFVAGTFCHHPLAMATAKATLVYLKERNGLVQEALNKKTTALCDHLNAWFQEEGYPVSMVNFGSLFRFQLKGKGKLLYYALLKEGVYIWEGRNCFLSTAHGDETINELIQKIKKSTIELAASGCLRRSILQKPRTTHLHFIQGAISLHGLLHTEHLELAVRYLVSAIPALKNEEIAVHIVPLSCSDNINEWILNHRSNKAFEITLMKKEACSVLHMQASKNVCDGWSLILFIRELARCYSALQNHIPMPQVYLSSDEQFARWVTADHASRRYTLSAGTLMEAGSVHQEIDLQNRLVKSNGNMFPCLLMSFKHSVRHLNKEIAVPVAGQLISRNPRTFGACSTHIPLSSAGRSDEKAVETERLKDATIFKNAFLAEKKVYPIVFNFDDLNWQLDFSGVRTKFFTIDEHTTAHELVCNVSYLDSKLVVSLKYAKANYTAKQAGDLLRTIVQNMEADLYL